MVVAVVAVAVDFIVVVVVVTEVVVVISFIDEVVILVVIVFVVLQYRINLDKPTSKLSQSPGNADVLKLWTNQVV